MAQRVLVVDVGGTHLKILASGQETPRKVASGSKMTPQLMCNWVRKAASDWHYEVAAIGYRDRTTSREAAFKWGGDDVGDPIAGLLARIFRGGNCMSLILKADEKVAARNWRSRNSK